MLLIFLFVVSVYASPPMCHCPNGQIGTLSATTTIRFFPPFFFLNSTLTKIMLYVEADSPDDGGAIIYETADKYVKLLLLSYLQFSLAVTITYIPFRLSF
uniref:Secreted protein n=1 Tax=Heterorhabditis bacteriophora TaxID=37862 RepID=A0A1I7WH78_HETBA